MMRFALGIPAPARPLDHFRDPAFDAAGIVGLWRGVGLGHQYVAIGQDIKRARMVEPSGEGVHGHSIGGDRLAAGWPAAGGGNVDGRDPGMLRRWQRRRRPKALFGGARGRGLVTGGERKRQRANRYCEQDIFAHRDPLRTTYNAENRPMFAAPAMKSVSRYRVAETRGWR
jgi:hypothetical protein